MLQDEAQCKKAPAARLMRPGSARLCFHVSESKAETFNDGGQRGCAVRQECQPLTLSNRQLTDVEKIAEFGPVPNQKPIVQAAAMWLAQHRENLKRPVIPTLRQGFGLTNLEAIEATKIAHALAHSGANNGA